MLPLILQIQADTLDSKASLTDALRKAKLACSKLGLTEFGKWIDKEMDGYVDATVDDLPEYRKLYGTPEGFNPYHGWRPIVFETSATLRAFSLAPISSSIPSI